MFRSLILCSTLTLLLGPPALAQGPGQHPPVIFSIDWQGPTPGTVPPTGGNPISEGDLLVQLPSLGGDVGPVNFLTGDLLGLPNYGCGVGCGVEIDALSFGHDLEPDGSTVNYYVFFSVDEYAVGIQQGISPSIPSEFMGGDISADVFATFPAVQANFPPPPLGPVFPHAGIYDGNGLPSLSGAIYPGLGLVEPNRPGFGLPAFPMDEGDNLDALDIGTPAADQSMIFFSVDASILSQQVPGTSTAQSLGFLGSDILVVQPGGTPLLYAQSQELGLGIAGPDDLDALVVSENNLPGFQASQVPFDWVDLAGPGPPGADMDMVLFSARAGSAVIGMPDSRFGVPITAGDLLTTPLPTALGGLSPFPAIFRTAESMGMEADRNSGMGDDMNAADIEDEDFEDCQPNGSPDGLDIGSGVSNDDNMNGIPDECEDPGSGYCYCPTTTEAICGNTDASAGCANSTGTGGVLEGLGSSSIFTDDLVLSMTNLLPFQPGILIMGGGQLLPGAPRFDGRQCVATGAGGVHFYPTFFANASGVASVSGVVGYSGLNFPMPGVIIVGSTWNFQAWYRDPIGSPCGNNANITNAWSVTFTM